MTPPIWKWPSGFARLLAERGLLCLAWPEDFGGRGASVWEQTVVREEMWAHHEPRGAQYMGVNWVGPIIMRHGTEEQQRKHLPPIAHGEVIWCQGFSEPEAGSDLASLRTAARRDGDGWTVSGQKIWTSYATMAQWCFLLARTSKGEKKQQGLTIFLVPMDDPAIQVRPIRAMFGPHHLNEVFFDDLQVTEADVLGPVDGGWSIVQDVMSFERVGIARYARCERLLAAAPSVLGDRWDDAARGITWAVGADAHALPPRAVARLSGGLVAEQRTDTTGRRGRVPDRGHQARPGQRRSTDGDRGHGTQRRCGHPVLPRRSGRPLAVLAGVHSGVRQHRDATHPAVPGLCWRRRMILDLGEEANEFGREALRAFETAGGDQLLQQAEAKPDTREPSSPRSWTGWARGSSTSAPTPIPGRRPPRCAAARVTGRCPIPWPNGCRGRPTSTSTV